jgi:hypothetical protein
LGGRRRISTAGGSIPRWQPDGKELFYVSADGRMMAAEADGRGGSFEVKKVDALFGPVCGLGEYDVSADGQRFLAVLPPGGWEQRAADGGAELDCGAEKMSRSE